MYRNTNLVQISWGTKQDDIVEVDLGAVVRTAYAQVDVELITEPADVNSLYDEALSNIRTRKPIQSPAGPTAAANEQDAKDYYANVRTNVRMFSSSRSRCSCCAQGAFGVGDLQRMCQFECSSLGLTYLLGCPACSSDGRSGRQWLVQSRSTRHTREVIPTVHFGIHCHLQHRGKLPYIYMGSICD